MIVVSDTGPIHYLALIDAEDVLPALFGSVTIPKRVAQELCHARAPSKVREFVGSRPDWLVVAAPAPPLEQTHRLDAGEEDAIATGHALGAGLLLMDDRRGVAAARALAMNTLGTLGILELAARRNLLDLVSAVAKLSATNFRLTPRLVAALLRL